MTDREQCHPESPVQSPTLGDLLPASAPGVDYQLIWDQMVVRGWIVEWYMGNLYHVFHETVGGAVDFDSLQRVPRTFLQEPVRAMFARQWPKLSNWLWSTKPRERYTDEFEARVVRLLQTRKVKTNAYDKYIGEASKAATYGRKLLRAGAIGMCERGREMNHRHDWHVTKPVRSK